MKRKATKKPWPKTKLRLRSTTHTVIEVPVDLVPEVRELIAKHKGQLIEDNMSNQEIDRTKLTFSQAEGIDPLPQPAALGELPGEARTDLWNI